MTNQEIIGKGVPGNENNHIYRYHPGLGVNIKGGN